MTPMNILAALVLKLLPIYAVQTMQVLLTTRYSGVVLTASHDLLFLMSVLSRGSTGYMGCRALWEIVVSAE